MSSSAGTVRERLADEGGTAVIEFVWLAILMLVPLIYLVLCLARLQAGSYAVTQAARESARAFVTARGPTTRIKGCYELTGYVVMKQKVPAGTEMVFGHWQVGQGLEGFDIPHVWLQLPDGRIWEPVSATLDEAEAQIDRHGLREYDHVEKTRFSDKEAIRHGVSPLSEARAVSRCRGPIVSNVGP